MKSFSFNTVISVNKIPMINFKKKYNNFPEMRKKNWNTNAYDFGLQTIYNI